MANEKKPTDTRNIETRETGGFPPSQCVEPDKVGETTETSQETPKTGDSEETP